MESPSVEVRERLGCSMVGSSRYRVQSVEEHSAGARKALHEISSGPPRPLVTDEEILHGQSSEAFCAARAIVLSAAVAWLRFMPTIRSW